MANFLKSINGRVLPLVQSEKPKAAKKKDIAHLVRNLYPKAAHKVHDRIVQPYMKEVASWFSYSKNPERSVRYSYGQKGGNGHQLAKSMGTYAKQLFDAPALLGKSFFYLWEFTYRRFSAGFSAMERRLDLYNASLGNGPSIIAIQDMELAAMRALRLLESSDEKQAYK